MAIGIDLVECVRFKKHLEKKENLKKMFFPKEIDAIFDVQHSLQRASGYFAAKEACIKAFGQLGEQIGFKDIKIAYKENGAPYIVETSKIRGLLMMNECSYIELSISHTENYATSICQIGF